MKRSIVSLLLILIGLTFTFLSTTFAFANEKEIVSLGADLTPKQQEEMMEYFGVNPNTTKVIKVTNEEERKYLKGLVPDKQIGSRAISSVYVKLLPQGEGIMVDTHNISWVSKEMYANAMVTAGIKDAKVVVAAPFDVSGTAALTGIMKAFEEATGEKLSDEAKKTANEELVITGTLGEKIGKDKAAEEVIAKKLADENEIANVIRDIAKQLNIKLTDEQISQIVQLMKKINQLNLNVEMIKKQLEKIGVDVDKIKKTVEENKGILKAILDAIKSFFDWLASLFK